MYDRFVRQLRAGMAEAGINQKELAQRSGIHFVTINRILNGHMTNPTLGVMEKLLNAARGNGIDSG